MLITFDVENYLSLRDRQSLSLVASKLRDDHTGLIKTPAIPGVELLPSAVIYGPNAAGKSNLLNALMLMRSMVLRSHSVDVDTPLPHRPFLLDETAGNRPTEFDAEFICKEIRYNYGFSYRKYSIDSEWLYYYPKGRRVVLFERHGEQFKFGRSLKGQNVTISELTRKNSLFLSAAAQNDHEMLSRVRTFFRDLQSGGAISVSDTAPLKEFEKMQIDSRTIQFLAHIGTGVSGYRMEKRPLDPKVIEVRNKLLSSISDVLEKLPPEFALEDEENHLQLSHFSSTKNTVFFDLNRESAGTRRIMVIANRIFRAIDRGTPVIIDELDASLHTQACEALVQLFQDKHLNKNGAQLIATTHDTNLLDSPFLRRDQIWLCEKDDLGASHIFPLTDFHTRKGDAFEKGYLQGRYGAVPHIPDPKTFLPEA